MSFFAAAGPAPERIRSRSTDSTRRRCAEPAGSIWTAAARQAGIALLLSGMGLVALAAWRRELNSLEAIFPHKESVNAVVFRAYA